MAVLRSMSLAMGIVLMAWCGTSLAGETAPVAPVAPVYTQERIEQLVKQLGDESFDKRKNAEKELLAAGVKAKAALTAALASTDAQVKTTARKLLAHLKYATLGAINYFDILPGGSIFALKLSNIGETIKNGKETFIGKLLQSKPFEPLRLKLEEEMKKGAEGKKLFDLWSSRFQGQAAGAVWEFNIMAGPQGIKAAAIAEITADDPEAVYAELLALMPQQGEATAYKDVEITEGPNGSGATALVGRHLIVASNADAIKVLMDNLGNAAPKSIAQSPAFQKAKASLREKNELILTIDFQAYFKALAVMIPQGAGDLMAASGIKNLSLAVYSSAIVGESFEDRIVGVMEGEPEGFRLAVLVPAGAPAPLGTLALAPANAVAAQCAYVDGAKMAAAFKNYFAAMQKMMAGINPKAAADDPIAKLGAFEQATGIKLDDVAANIKGNLAMWAVLAPPPSLSAPDLGAVLTCVDAEKAKAMAGALATLINKGSGKEVVKEIPWKTYSIYQVDLRALDQPKAFPYPQPCFAVDGTQVFIASSSQALQKELNNVAAKAPGLLSSPEFVKAMASLKPEERRGQVGYVDLKSLLTLAGDAALPLLAAGGKNPEVKQILATLPPPAEMFKDMPPMIYCSNDQGGLSTTIMRAPLPLFPTVIAASIVVGTVAEQQRRAAMNPAPAPAPAP